MHRKTKWRRISQIRRRSLLLTSTSLPHFGPSSKWRLRTHFRRGRSRDRVRSGTSGQRRRCLVRQSNSRHPLNNRTQSSVSRTTSCHQMAGDPVRMRTSDCLRCSDCSTVNIRCTIGPYRPALARLPVARWPVTQCACARMIVFGAEAVWNEATVNIR